MPIENYSVTTAMGKIHSSSSDPLNFLTPREIENFNEIGYTGKTLEGQKMSRLQYLNSLGKGEFKIIHLHQNNSEFTEKMEIIRVSPVETIIPQA